MAEESAVTQKPSKTYLGKKNMLLFLGAVLAGFILVIAIGISAQPYRFKGSKINPPALANDFSLIDQHGNEFHLAENRGKVILIFFGYTNCPDICPTTLADFKQINEKLGERADDVVFLFVTIDPERDTPDRLAKYLPVFGEGIIGLSGSEDELRPVWKDFGVYRSKVDSGSAAGYLMDHSTRVYGLDKDGNIRVTYPFGSPLDSYIKDVNYLLNE